MKIQKRWSLPMLVAVVGLMLLFCSSAHAGLPDTGQTKCYNDTEEIPCPSPGQDFYGQDGNYTRPRSYTDLGNGIIRDNVTGLMWQKATAVGTSYNWQQALDYCDSLSLGGYSDWRLPTIMELSTLSDAGRYDLAINMTYFPDTVRATYWSSTTSVHDSDILMWGVHFYLGGVSVSNRTGGGLHVRAVRGRQYQISNSFIDNVDGTAGACWLYHMTASSTSCRAGMRKRIFIADDIFS